MTLEKKKAASSQFRWEEGARGENGPFICMCQLEYHIEVSSLKVLLI